jgi:DNA-binding HxlR family transcriptional regulator
MFLSEKYLVQAFKDVATDFLKYNIGKSPAPFFLVEEFDSYCGIADIVVGTGLPLEPQDLSRKTINWNWVRPIFDLSEDQEIEMDGFIQTYGISKTTAKARLKEYSEAGFLEKISKGHYRVVREYKLVTETIISIEAKLSNWQRALHQAIRYKRFSNKSYVLLDNKYIKPALKNIHAFQERNIGLMSMASDGYTIHYSPKDEDVPRTHSFFRLNEAAFDCFKEQEAYV